MRNLIHRLGCLFQVVYTVAIGGGLARHTDLHMLVLAPLAVVGGMVATFATVALSSVVLDRFEDGPRA